MSKNLKRTAMALFVGAGFLLLAAGAAMADVSLRVGVSNDQGGVIVDSDKGLVIWGGSRAPGGDYVRVEVAPLAGDVALPAFWRVKFRAGFVWVDGRWDNDRYIPGYWQPERPRGPDWAWVPGHWVFSQWIPGCWRPVHRDGYVWDEGHWTPEGEWIEGHWTPVHRPREDVVWEPGYRDHRGIWVEGFWRLSYRPGYLWVGGEYDRHLRWTKGHWKRARPDQIWIKGYWDNHGRWFPGRLSRVPQSGHRYSHGYYNHRGQWVEPRWIDEKSWQQREKERQTANYRRDREGAPSREEQIENYRNDREGPPPGGGEVRQIGGPEPRGGEVRQIGGGPQDQSGYRPPHEQKDKEKENQGLHRGWDKQDKENPGLHRGWDKSQEAPGQDKGPRNIKEQPPADQPPGQEQKEQNQPDKDKKDQNQPDKDKKDKKDQKSNYRNTR